jgi:hypothetical protein
MAPSAQTSATRSARRTPAMRARFARFAAATIRCAALALLLPPSQSPASAQAVAVVRAAPAFPEKVQDAPSAARADLKRRIALVRVEDHSAFPGHGEHGLGAGEDPAALAGALLVAGMAAGGECIVLKSGQLGDMDRVAGVQGREPEVIGVTAFLYGSVDKLSMAHAKVSVRMVDPLTGAAFFSESGEADAAPEPSGFLRAAPAADPDSSPPRRALRAAVDKLVSSMSVSLRAQPWRAGILEAADGKVVITAGARAGLRPGRELRVVRPGKRVREPTSGVVIELPGEEVGRIKVLSQFGTGELDEGSICALLKGSGITQGDWVERADRIDRIDRIEERR